MKVHILTIALLCMSGQNLYSRATSPALPDEGILIDAKKRFYDTSVDHSRFSGRVSDKDSDDTLLKIQVENNNTKFFRKGDRLEFKVEGFEKRDPCKAHVESVEDFYFVIKVNFIGACWKVGEYFRRGTRLNFYSPVLFKRLSENNQYRNILVKKRKSFFRQLNQINNFLWTYDQEKVKLAAEYDKQILALEQEKMKALDNLSTRKADSIRLQEVLTKKIDQMDSDLKFYKIENLEALKEGWKRDYELGVPVKKKN